MKNRFASFRPCFAVPASPHPDARVILHGPLCPAGARRRRVFRLPALALLVGLTVGFGFSARAGTIEMFFQNNALNSGTNYNPSGLPTSSTDILFSTYPTTSANFTITGTTLAAESLNDTDTSGTITISNNTTSTTASTLTLGNPTQQNDAVTGSGAADLLYVASGAALNIQGPNGSTGSGTLKLALAQTGNFDIVGSSAVSSIISGAFAIQKTGAGTLTLAGANTFTLGVTLTTGTLNLNAAAAVGTGTFTIGAGTTLDNTLGSTVTATNALTLNGDFVFTGTSALTLSGAASLGTNAGANRTITVNGSTLGITGVVSNGTNGTTPTQGITKTGTGTLALGNTNTFSGGLNILAGTVTDTGGNGHPAAFGTGPIVLGDSGGTADTTLTGYANGANNIAYTNAITVASGNMGTASITKAGAGTSANFSGAITLQSHDLTVANNGGGGTLVLGGGVTTSASGTRTITATGAGNVQVGVTAAVATDGSGQLSFAQNGTGVLLFGGVNTFTGDILVNSGSISGAAGSAGVAGNFGTGNTIYLGAATGTAFAGSNATIIDGGNGGIAIANAVNVRGTGTNTFTELTSNATGALSGLVTLGTNLTINYTTSSGGTGGVAIGTSTAGTYLTGAGTLTSQNNGTSTNSIYGTNTGFTGNVTVDTGSLKVQTTAALGNTPAITVNNTGMLQLGVANAIGGGGVTTKPTLTINSGGTFASNNLNNGPTKGAAGSTPQIGALTLNTNSTIDFGTGNSSNLLFTSLIYTAGNVVTIAHFDGTVGADSGAATNDRLLFSTDPGLTAAQLSGFQFTDDTGAALGAGAMEITFNGYTELVPVAVPEPSTALMGLLVTGLLGYRGRNRLRALFRRDNKMAA